MAISAESIFSGGNPLSDPTALFLLQVLVIICTARLIAIPLGYIKQPKVIAEVIGGILLGRSAMCRIPGFEATLFPEESKGKLKLIAEFGLIFYLFLVCLLFYACL